MFIFNWGVKLKNGNNPDGSKAIKNEGWRLIYYIYGISSISLTFVC